MAAVAVLAMSVGIAYAGSSSPAKQATPTAPSVITTNTGTNIIGVYEATNDNAFDITSSTPSGTWVNLPGMIRTVTIPAGTRAFLSAHYTAEVACDGGSWCAARIIYVNPNGGAVELYPQSGTDNAFDSPNSSGTGPEWQNHAMDRSSPYLPAGTYKVLVQGSPIGTVSDYRLDDDHFEVQVIR